MNAPSVLRVTQIPAEVRPGILLLLSAIAAMLVANSPVGPGYDGFLGTPASIAFGARGITMPLSDWVKNLLMAVFFFYAGLELKREMRAGALASPAKALLPLMAAAGGILLPAAIYLAIAAPAGHAHGWAIPAATDIAFALGVLALLGNRVPAALKAFLLAVAVIDDLAAILIIAFFYSEQLATQWLPWIALWSGVLFLLNRRGAPRLGLYLLVAIPLWIAIQESGINPTIAGVIAACAIPMRDRRGRSLLVDVEHGLRPYVLYGILPLFALAMAGTVLGGDLGAAMAHPVTLGILLGLVVGKPAGITAMTFIGCHLLRIQPPGRMIEILGIGCIAGIGFTMSLFIGKLAFSDPGLQLMLKLGVYAGSLLSAALGLAILGSALRARTSAECAREVDETDVFIGDMPEDRPARYRNRI